MIPTFREARTDDLEGIVRLHEQDTLGGHGDVWSDETRPAYEAAFAAIQASPGNAIYVAEEDGRLVGTFQLTFIPNLTGRGKLRAKIESVKVAEDRRSQGIGARLMAFAEEVARARGAATIELTSNNRRIEAHRFYARIGYEKSHAGFKKHL